MDLDTISDLIEALGVTQTILKWEHSTGHAPEDAESFYKNSRAPLYNLTVRINSLIVETYLAEYGDELPTSRFYDNDEPPTSRNDQQHDATRA